MKDQIESPPLGASGVGETQLLNAYRWLDSDPPRAVSALTELAESGSPEAMLYLGYALRNGIGVTADLQGAETWYRRAADGGVVRARYHLGRLYLDASRYADARLEFEQAAANHFAPGVHFLGRIYYFGYGVPVDRAQGKALLESAARSGCLYAKALLAQDSIQTGGIGGAVNGLFMKLSCFVSLISIVLVEGISSDRLR